MNQLIILTGPTAVGKTDLSINLAKRINGEIISADSAQVYKGLNVGSAKIKPEEMQGVPHHLIDVYDANFSFDVTVFQRDAKRLVEEIYSRGHVPIVVGGTGFYIQALLYDIDFCDEGSEHISSFDRKNLESELLELSKNPIEMHNRLRAVDPISADKIHYNNVRKVMRALEFYKIHGYPISAHNENERKKESIYDSYYFVLTMNREKLYERINKRVDIMKREGLVDEVRKLLDEGVLPTATSMQAIGYKEIIEALQGSKNYPEQLDELLDIAFEKIKLNTRHFAKRQMTWFRREKDVIYLDKDEMNEDEILDKIISYL